MGCTIHLGDTLKGTAEDKYAECRPDILLEEEGEDRQLLPPVAVGTQGCTGGMLDKSM